jgi:hypothetical protein
LQKKTAFNFPPVNLLHELGSYVINAYTFSA